MKRFSLFWIVVLGVAHFAAAQPGRITLKADRVLDGRGAAWEGTLVVVEGATIVRLGGP
ncbi:MAG: hypothetical protein V3T83_14255 [Acidobacteriota bacterium]